eukprot:1183313-Prorocentrum_minimum.AAC.4
MAARVAAHVSAILQPPRSRQSKPSNRLNHQKFAASPASPPYPVAIMHLKEVEPAGGLAADNGVGNAAKMLRSPLRKHGL